MLFIYIVGGLLAMAIHGFSLFAFLVWSVPLVLWLPFIYATQILLIRDESPRSIGRESED